jgi:hypothetical protein
MKNNIEQIPNEIFDWIELYSFQELAQSQQQQVLQHLSIEEYNQMHQTAFQLSNMHWQVQNNNKQELLNLLDFKTKSKNKPTTNIWRAASAILLICTSFLFYKNFSNTNQGNQFVKSIHDTIFINKNIATISKPIHDTIEIIKNSIALQKPNPIITRKKIAKKGTEKLFANTKTITKGLPSQIFLKELNRNEIKNSTEQIQILQAKCNSDKNNSRSRSTLEKQIKLISM